MKKPMPKKELTKKQMMEDKIEKKMNDAVKKKGKK